MTDRAGGPRTDDEGGQAAMQVLIARSPEELDLAVQRARALRALAANEPAGQGSTSD